MTDVNLNELNLDELKEQARILGVSLKGGLSEDTIKERILEAMGEKPVESKPVTKTKNTVTIVIAEDDNDSQPVFVGVNGKSYRIKRGMEVAVPKEVADVLQQSKQRFFRNGDWVTRPTYPFQIVG